MKRSLENCQNNSSGYGAPKMHLSMPCCGQTKASAYSESSTKLWLFLGSLLGAKNSTQTFFVQSFSTTLRVMDVRAENRGRPHQKVRFPTAPVVGRNFLTLGHPGVRVRNVRGKSGPKSLCLCCFLFEDLRAFPRKVLGNLRKNSGKIVSHHVMLQEGTRLECRTPQQGNLSTFWKPPFKSLF